MVRIFALSLPILAIIFFSRNTNKGQGVPQDPESSLARQAPLEKRRSLSSGSSDSDRSQEESAEKRELGKVPLEALDANRNDDRQISSGKVAGPIRDLKKQLLNEPQEVLEPDEIVEAVYEHLDPALTASFSVRDYELLDTYIERLTTGEKKEVHWCFEPDFGRDRALAFHQVEEIVAVLKEGPQAATQFLNGGIWRRTALDPSANGRRGRPVRVTWGFLDDGTQADNIEGGTGPSDLRVWLRRIYGGSLTGPAENQPWFRIFNESIQEMADQCGLSLIYEPEDDGATAALNLRGVAGVRADIRIGARPIPGSRTLAFAFSPASGGDIVFNSASDAYNNTSQDSRLLFNVMAHELGHALGLAHVCPLDRTKLMEPIATTSFRGPQIDELQSLQTLYGDRFEDRPARNNDSIANAFPFSISGGETRVFDPASLNSSFDTDYYQFTSTGDQEVTVALLPRGRRYLEGGQNDPNGPSNCSSGRIFDGRRQQNLAIRIFDPSGLAIAVMDDAIIGEEEVLESSFLPEEGQYTVEVSGIDGEGAQLYALEVSLNAGPPAPRLNLGVFSITDETGSGDNGLYDPRETVRVRLPIFNRGTLPTSNLQASLTLPEGLELFSSEIGEVNLARFSETSLDLTFGITGDCSEFLNIGVVLSDDTGELGESVLNFEIGAVDPEVLLIEDFDETNELPEGWSSSAEGDGTGWSSVSRTGRFESPIRALFAGNQSGGFTALQGVSELVSPEFLVGDGGMILSFFHYLDADRRVDGGVVEVSRNGGEFNDLLLDNTVRVTGGYNETIRDRVETVLGGREAFSDMVGSPGDFAQVMATLPSAWAGETIRFRWLYVTDEEVSEEGWFIDSVRVSSLSLNCVDHRPELSLAISADSLAEGGASSVLTVSSTLPLLDDLDFEVATSGSAGEDDFSGILTGTIVAGQSSVDLVLNAVEDGLDEESETLTLFIPDDRALFAPVEDEEISITIVEVGDAASLAEWLEGFFPTSPEITGDTDGDSFSELGEYLLGTDPSSASSQPRIVLVNQGDNFLIPFEDLPLRSDAEIVVQSSLDLQDWNDEVSEVAAEGIRFSLDEAPGLFVRLSFRLIATEGGNSNDGDDS